MSKTDMPDWFKTFSFSMPVDTKATEFFKETQAQHTLFHDTIEQRIRQLTDQFIQIDERADDKLRNIVYNLFAYGYQNGWNDYKHIIDNEKKKEL